MIIVKVAMARMGKKGVAYFMVIFKYLPFEQCRAVI